MSEDIQIEKYVFYEFREDAVSVIFRVKRFNNKHMEEEDKNRISELFGYMGKWETLLKPCIQLINDLDISVGKEVRKDYEQPFGREKYCFDFSKPKRDRAMNADPSRPSYQPLHIEIQVNLTDAEKQIREDSKPCQEEIKNQLKNIPKWMDLIKTVDLVKSIID